MGLADIVGFHYRHPECYEVGREKIREHAIAVQNDDASFYTESAAAELGYDVLLAPLTFISIFGYQAQLAMFGAGFISFPIVANQIYKFVAPGLYKNERAAFLRRWAALIDDGTLNRGDVLLGIANSAEMAALVGVMSTSIDLL